MSEKSRPDELEQAYQIICACGDDSQHGLNLNTESSFFFGSEVCGVIPYTPSRGKSMSQGDPVCRFADREQMLDEYLAFCRQNGYRPVFNSVSAEMADLLRRKGFRVLKYGEEAILDLGSYSLSGGKKGALRRNTAKLNRAGVTLEEYTPEKARDIPLEHEIAELEEQWFAGKELKLTYSIGDLHFEEPYGRRYFVSRDSEGQLQTVLSFLPYRRGKGYCVDVMYRRPDGLTGAMEHAIISAAMKMRYLVYDRRIPLVRLALSITNTKGVRNIRFYLRYARFFASLFLYPERFRKHQNKHSRIRSS